MENTITNFITKNTETLYSMHTMTISAYLTTMDKNILIYNKYRQLEKEAQKYSLEEIQAANGMIRIELRIKRPGIYQRSKKYQLSDAQEFLKHVSHMAGIDIPRYLKKCYGTGNFTTLDHARKLVQNSNYQTKTKEDLLVMLALVNSKRSLHAARETLTPKNYKKCMKKFNELGISPITIPRRSTATTFFNPLHYIKYHNCNYRNQDICHSQNVLLAIQTRHGHSIDRRPLYRCSRSLPAHSSVRKTSFRLLSAKKQLRIHAAAYIAFSFYSANVFPRFRHASSVSSSGVS